MIQIKRLIRLFSYRHPYSGFAIFGRQGSQIQQVEFDRLWWRTDALNVLTVYDWEAGAQRFVTVDNTGDALPQRGYVDRPLQSINRRDIEKAYAWKNSSQMQQRLLCAGWKNRSFIQSPSYERSCHLLTAL